MIAMAEDRGERFINYFSLFVIAGPSTDLDDFDEIVVEATADAVTRMSIFIGDKKYKEDFI